MRTLIVNSLSRRTKYNEYSCDRTSKFYEFPCVYFIPTEFDYLYGIVGIVVQTAAR